MTANLSITASRRAVLMGGAGGIALLLPGCAGTGTGFSLTEAIRRLLLLSSENAFARLTAPGGFWDSQVAQLGLGTMLGARGDTLSRILTSGLVKDRLEERFAEFAVEASFRAAPVVADAVQVIGIGNAIELVRGGPGAASGFLRAQMGDALLDAMVPGLGDGLAMARDPLVGELLGALTGVNTAEAATRIGRVIDDAIWGEIAAEEAAIRANPQATRDPLLISVFGASARI